MHLEREAGGTALGPAGASRLNDSTPLEAALIYAWRHKLRVFPLNGYEPRISNWAEAATMDEATIRRWWTQWPDAGVGVLTGHGIAVVEVDYNIVDDESWWDLIDAHGELPETPNALCPYSVHQHWFTAEPGLPSRTLTHCAKLKAAGSFVVALPSVEPPIFDGELGESCTWRIDLDSLPLAPLPAWVVQLPPVVYRQRPPMTVERLAEIREQARELTERFRRRLD